jgi:hypothetical protein
VAPTDTMTPPEVLPAPAPAPPPPPVVVAAAPKPKPRTKPRPVPAPAVVDKTPALAPVVVVAPKPAPNSAGAGGGAGKGAKPAPKPPPPPPHPTAAELAADSVRRDSVARAEFVQDSISRERAALALAQAQADSMHRAELMRDSIQHAQFVRDSLARALAERDSLAKLAARDSLFGPQGDMPRIEGDPNIQRPTASAQLTFVDQVNDTYQQIQFGYARPFAHRSASWEIDVPIQHWDSVGGNKTVTSLANISLIVNKRISSRNATWRQFASLTLLPQTGLENESVGNDQWVIQGQWSASRWFFDERLHFRFLPSWTYGWWVNTSNGTKQKNVIVPRMVVTGRVTSTFDASLDFRPRIDLARGEFYSTLMALVSTPLPWELGLQAGYEFPLDSLAKKHVEESKVYINVTKTFK